MDANVFDLRALDRRRGKSEFMQLAIEWCLDQGKVVVIAYRDRTEVHKRRKHLTLIETTRR